MRRKVWTFNVAVDFWRHPKAVQAGRDGRDLFLVALGWSGEYRRNGRIPTEVLDQLAALVGITPAAARKARAKLVEVGMWEPVDDGWLIHDYLEWQMSAEERDARAEANAARQREWKEKRRPPKRGSNARGNALPNAPSNGPGDAQRGVSVNEPLSVEEVQSSSPGGSGGATTTDLHPEAVAACRLLAEIDLERRRAEKPDDAPPADRPDRCEPWLATGTERRIASHGDQAHALALQQLDAADIAAALTRPDTPSLALVHPPPARCSLCGQTGHARPECPLEDHG